MEAVPASNVPNGTVEATITLRRTRVDAQDTVTLTMRVPGTSVVDVGAGHYVVEAQAPGWWMAPALVEVGGRSGVTLKIRRAGAIEGTITGFPDGAEPKLLVRFEHPEASLSGEGFCTTDRKSFRCVVPEGKLDLRIAAPSYVPHYRWAIAVVAEESSALGSLRFVPGASLSGRLELEEGTRRGARLSLERTDQKQPPIAIEAQQNGFFSAGPIPTGSYSLSGSHKGLVAAPRTVRIREGLEAQVREPIVLAKPRRAEFTIAPATTPSGGQWGVQLSRLTEGEKPVLSARGLSELDGGWSADKLAPGDYELTVSPQGGPVWYSQRLSISEPVTSRHIEMRGIRFQGTVRLGRKPLAAQLIFGGEHAPHTIRWRSDERGEFSGYLPAPPEGRWSVTIKSETPRVNTTLTDVVPAFDKSSDAATIDIVLPASGIAGSVIDEQGHAVPHAGINISTPGAGIVQIGADEKGDFEIRGMRPGTYMVTATRFLKESDPAELTLHAGNEEPARVRLALKPYRKWAGRVTSTDRQPVPHAEVYAVAVDAPVVMALPGRTDADGRFAVLVPDKARLFDISVAPPGYAFSYFRGTSTETLDLVVDRRGGTLLIDTPNDRAVLPRIWHDGAVNTPFGFGWSAQFEESPPDRLRIRVPQMEPGEYTICLTPSDADHRTAAPSGECKTVYLAPFAEEFISLHSRAGTASR